ncbi:MAG: response regulator, partial [Planctomycetota bacterium]
MNSSQPSSKGTAGKSISDARILLVDDDQYLAQSMAQWLGEQGIRVDVALSKSAAQQLLRSEPYDLMLVDLRLGGEDGFEMIAPTVAEYPNCAVLVITGYATPDTAIQCVRAGAFDLLTKPLLDDELML